jgi:hypothetical protein
MFGLLRVFLRLPKGIKYLENKARIPTVYSECLGYYGFS